MQGDELGAFVDVEIGIGIAGAVVGGFGMHLHEKEKGEKNEKIAH